MNPLKQRISQLFDTDQKKYIAFGALIVVMIILMLGIVAGVRQNSREQTSSDNKSGLASSTIKVGDNPYIDPCSVLTLDNLRANTSGELVPAGTYASENYFDSSVPNDRYSTIDAIQTRCRYKPLVERTAKVMSLDVAHAKNTTDDMKALLGAIEPSPETIDADIKALDATLKNGGTTKAKAFVDKLRVDKTRAINYVNDKESSVPIGAVVPNVLTQDYGSGISIDQQLSFVVVTKYALVKFNYVIDDAGKPFTQLSAAELSKGLEQAEKHTASILKNTSDASLSEKPIDARLGTSETPWKLKILNPCAVLTNEVFKSVTGVDENDQINLTTLPSKYDFDRQQNKRIGVSSNTCEREFSASKLSKTYQKTDAEAQYGKSGIARVSLDISYALDTDQAKAALDLTALGKPNIPSDVDELRRVGESTFVFNKGNYVYRFDLKDSKGVNKTTLSDDQIRSIITQIIKNSGL